MSTPAPDSAAATLHSMPSTAPDIHPVLPSSTQPSTQSSTQPSAQPSTQYSINSLPDLRLLPSDEKTLLRRRIKPTNADGYTELTVAVVGNVDAGKSTTVGTLVTGMQDNGNGMTRRVVFVHQHEAQTGRTSDISYQYMVDDATKRIISFVDLAGHERYLRTTMAGLTSTTPDFAIVCISDQITRMTREHMGLCIALDIPFAVVFTKSDMVKPHIVAELIVDIKRRIKNSRRQFYQIKEMKDFELITKHGMDRIIPYFHTSNVSGAGLNILMHLLRICTKRPQTRSGGFVVEHIYNVPGHGVVLSGISGELITKGDTLFMGPFAKGEFMQITVRSIHNDYRWPQETLPACQRGCLAIGLTSKERRGLNIRKGLVLSHQPPSNVCREFYADVEILHHATSIKVGYQAFANAGMLREAVKFVELTDLQGERMEIVRAQNNVRIRMQFLQHLNYVEVGQRIAFREGAVRGVGIIRSICPLE